MRAALALGAQQPDHEGQPSPQQHCSSPSPLPDLPPMSRKAECAFSSLDDGLITRVLGFLPQADRCRAAAVSKRWSRCSTSPQLLQCLDVRFAAAGSPQAAELPTLRSWAAFMLRHGRHVRRLTLRVYRADSAEAQLLLNTGLTACAAAEAQVLEDLSLAFWCSGGALLASEWAAALTGLQRLKLIAADELRVTANLAGLCQLHTLRLLSARVILEPQVQLPTSLQAVRLGDSCSGELPRQLSALPLLTSLVLESSVCSSDSYSLLTTLSSLRWLDITACTCFPTCLSQLTGLTTLVLDGSFNPSGDDGEEEDEGAAPVAVVAEAVGDALRHLFGLRRLLLSGSPEGLPPPPSVYSLPRLEHCCLGTAYQVYERVGMQTPQWDAAELQLGPWARRLRSLGANFATLLSSVPLLAAADQLEHICILGPPTLPPRLREQDAAFWSWALQHPPLRRLSFDMHDQGCMLPAGVLCAALDLQRWRPELRVEGIGDFRGGSLYDAYFEVDSTAALPSS